MGDGRGVAELRPELFGQVWDEGRQHADEAIELVASQGFGLVDKLEDGGDGGVETEFFDVLAYFGNEAVEVFLSCLINRFIWSKRDGGVFVCGESPDFLEEALKPDDVAGGPRLTGFEGAHVHFIEAESVGAVVFDDIVGVDNIFE